MFNQRCDGGQVGAILDRQVERRRQTRISPGVRISPSIEKTLYSLFFTPGSHVVERCQAQRDLPGIRVCSVPEQDHYQISVSIPRRFHQWRLDPQIPLCDAANRRSKQR